MPCLPALADLSRCPVMVAPMGGGPSTPDLVLAAAEAGAVGFLAAGYKTAAGGIAGPRGLAAVRAAGAAAAQVGTAFLRCPERSSSIWHAPWDDDPLPRHDHEFGATTF